MKVKKILLCLVLEMVCFCVFSNDIKANEFKQIQPYYESELLVYPYGSYDTSVVFDVDDFETEEDYLKYARDNSIVVSEDNGLHRSARSSFSDVTPTVDCIANLDSDHNHAIQAFYRKNANEVYISQKYDKIYFNGFLYNDPSKYVLISRCKREKVNGRYEFHILDSMLLEGVGHGQTLESYTYNNKTYFLVSCGGAVFKDNNDNVTGVWSQEIGRVQYKANTVVYNSNIDRLVDLGYFITDPTDSVKRVDAAIYGTSNLLIWTRTTKNKNHFAVYSFSKINKCLSNDVYDHTVSFLTNSALRNAELCSFDNPSNMPLSVQGLDISEKKNGMYSIYISSGNEKYTDIDGNQNRPLEIRHFKTDNSFVKGVHVLNTGLWTGYGEGSYYTATAEMEGFKYFSSKVWFVLRNTDKPSEQILCSMKTSELGK